MKLFIHSGDRETMFLSIFRGELGTVEIPGKTVEECEHWLAHEEFVRVVTLEQLEDGPALLVESAGLFDPDEDEFGSEPGTTPEWYVITAESFVIGDPNDE